MAEAATSIIRPELTLPEQEAECLRAAYQDARVVLEYGSGGSTVMAAEMPNKHVLSVESDRAWVQMMQAWFAENPPVENSKVDVIWADIGATGEWGHPKGHDNWRSFANYPLKVWSLSKFEQPDVVLVDGRFRSGCILAAAFRTTKPLRVFVDDYQQRKHYHKVESFVGTPRMHGRMAEFEIQPMPVPADRLLEIMEMMTHP
ncbi:hypothetical protein [Roseovarius sp. EL26]|uniref:hypothetical protein n=1 Tax=Roseovarius sp. EL26 TaxID=2126672 RepID=UPI000EA40509|nr:hypothetical protein [Roseovarius sp. EL26]